MGTYSVTLAARYNIINPYPLYSMLHLTHCDMLPGSRNSGGRAKRPLLDNGSVIMFPQQQIRLKQLCISYRVTSIPKQRIEKRFCSHDNEPPRHSNSEERDNSTVEGGDLHTVRPEPTSGREVANRR
jgi:hypothetical protein